MKEHKTGFAHLLASTKYSLSGLRVAVRETAVRHELYLGAAHFAAVFLLGVQWIPALVLSAIWVGIVVVELLNTAVEAVVDLVSPDYHELAGRAKDLGSAAVFLMLVLFFAAWALALWRHFAS